MTNVAVADPRQLLQENLGRLLRYAKALMKDPVKAEDLVQSVCVRALTKIHLWQHGTDFRAWVFTLMHNEYVNQVRKAVREGNNYDITEVNPAKSKRLQTRGSQEGQLELRDLRRAMDDLPFEQRQVVLLIGMEGMRYEEVAKLLEVPVGTIRSRLSRARDQLRRQIAGLPPDDDSEESAEIVQLMEYQGRGAKRRRRA